VGYLGSEKVARGRQVPRARLFLILRGAGDMQERKRHVPAHGHYALELGVWYKT
jgi:hypothetical protein